MVYRGAFRLMSESAAKPDSDNFPMVTTASSDSLVEISLGSLLEAWLPRRTDDGLPRALMHSMALVMYLPKYLVLTLSTM